MGSKGSNTTTTQSQSGPPGYVDSAYQGVIGRAQNVAQTPYQPYQGQMVAGLTPDQQSAFSTVNNTQGISQPYINQAAQWSQQSAAPISGGDISQYLNPYQQDVTNATMANINETNAQQQQQVIGSAIGKGAWGGDRSAVAQSELARQQGLASNATLAGLNQQNYSTALSTAQSDKNRAGQNAYTYGSLGQQALGNALTGAQAQMASGTVQQQQQQAELSNAYQQYQMAQAFPYQQTQWLAGIDSGIGSNAGGTSQGSTTAPAPNQTAQYAGLGMAGLGLAGQAGWLAPLAAMMKDGGAVTVPEKRPTLLAQQDQLTNGERPAQMFPNGTDELDLPPGMARTESPSGAFHFNPNSIGQDQIQSASASGRENDVLGLGSISKEEALTRIRNGEKPVAIVERGPDGTEVRSALGTDQTAPIQVQEMMRGKSPGHSLTIEDPFDVIDKRQRALGGRSGFALGGAPDGGGMPGMFGGAQSFIPQTSIAHGSGPPRPQGAGQQQQSPSSQNAIGMVNDAMKLGTQLKGTFGQPTSLAPDGGGYMPAGLGSVQMPSDITGGMGSPIYSHGGGVRGYDDGGEVPVQTESINSFADRFGAADSSVPQQPGLGAVQPMAFSGQPTGNAQSSFPNEAIKEPPAPPPDLPDDVSAYDDPNAKGSAQPSAGTRGKPDPWQSLTTAGFTLLANKSPFLGNAIGEAGLAGLGNYAAQKKELNTEGHQQATEDISRQGMKLRAQQLKDNLLYHQQALGISQQNANSLEKSRQDTVADRRLTHQDAAEARNDNLRTKTIAYKDADGNEHIAQFNPQTNKYEPTDMAPTPKGGASGQKVGATQTMLNQIIKDAAAKGETIDLPEANKRLKGQQDKQTKFQQAKDTADVKRMETYASAGQEADLGIAHLDNVDRLRKQAFTGPVIGTVAGMAGHPATQALNGAVNTMGLDIGKQMKGSLSDKDILFIQSQLPGLTTGTKAGEAISGMIRAGYERVKQRGLFYRQFGEKFHTLDGADAAWNGYINSDGRMTVDDPKAVGGARFNPNYNRNFSDYIAQPGEVRQFKQGQGVFDGRTWHPVNTETP